MTAKKTHHAAAKPAEKPKAAAPPPEPEPQPEPVNNSQDKVNDILTRVAAVLATIESQGLKHTDAWHQLQQILHDHGS